MTVNHTACVVTCCDAGTHLPQLSKYTVPMWWTYPHQSFSIKIYPYGNDLTFRRTCIWNALVLSIRLLGFPLYEHLWNQFSWFVWFIQCAVKSKCLLHPGIENSGRGARKKPLNMCFIFLSSSVVCVVIHVRVDLSCCPWTSLLKPKHTDTHTHILYVCLQLYTYSSVRINT